MKRSNELQETNGNPNGNITKPQRKQSRRKNFIPVNQVLNELISKLGLERRLKEHAVMNLWSILINDDLVQKSRPLFIDYEGKVVIAVKDASVGQELSLLKLEILKQLRQAAKCIGIKITGLRFDLKHYHSVLSASADNAVEFDQVVDFGYLKQMQPTKEMLKQMELSDENKAQISALAHNLGIEITKAEDEQESLMARRILLLFEQELKLRQWRKLNGFPICSLCCEPVLYLHGKNSVCADCFFQGEMASCSQTKC